MTSVEKYNPHPGEILNEDFLKPMKISQSALARAIGVHPRRINEVVLGKSAISARMDLLFAAYFKVSKGFFLGLQRDYDLMEAEEKYADMIAKVCPFVAA